MGYELRKIVMFVVVQLVNLSQGISQTDVVYRMELKNYDNLGYKYGYLTSQIDAVY